METGLFRSPALFVTVAEARQPLLHCSPILRARQKVWLSAKDLPLQVDSRKLAPRFVGPFVIDRIVHPSADQHKLSPSLNVHPMFHVSRMKLVSELDLVPPFEPLSCVIEGVQAYIAQCILDVCWHGYGLQLLVNWEGHGPEESSWIPRYHILDKSLLCDFYQDHLDKFGSVPGGPH